MAFLGTYRGGSLATDAAKGVSAGIDSILQHKLDQYQEAAAVKKFKAMGYPDEAARQFALFRNTPQVIGKLLTNYQGMSNQNEMNPQQNAYAQLNPNAQQEPQDMGFLNQIQNQQNPNGMMDVQRAYEMLSNPQSFAQQRMGQVPQQMQQQQQMPRPQPQQAMQEQMRQPQQIQQQTKPQQQSRGYPVYGSKAKSTELVERRLAQAEVKPLVQRHQQELEGELKIRESAQSALNALQKHKDKFKKQIWFGYPESWYRDPDISNYIADLKGIVNAQSAALPGRGSDYRTRLLEGAKVNINQPIEAQEERLKKIIKSTDYKIAENKELAKARKQRGYLTVEDFDELHERMGYGQSGQEQPRSVASIPKEQRPIGMKVINSKNNKPVYWDGNDWTYNNPLGKK